MCSGRDKMQIVYKEITRESNRRRGGGGGGGARIGEKELMSMRRGSSVSDALEKFLRR